MACLTALSFFLWIFSFYFFLYFKSVAKWSQNSLVHFELVMLFLFIVFSMYDRASTPSSSFISSLNLTTLSHYVKSYYVFYFDLFLFSGYLLSHHSFNPFKNPLLFASSSASTLTIHFFFFVWVSYQAVFYLLKSPYLSKYLLVTLPHCFFGVLWCWYSLVKCNQFDLYWLVYRCILQ